MQFEHASLRNAADSDEIVRLSIAGPMANSTIDPVAELYRLDCWPEQVRQYGDGMRKSAARLAEAKKNIDAAEKKLRSWKGQAGQAFRTRCGKLAWACEQARNRATNQSKEAEHIAVGVDELATRTATAGHEIAVSVDADCIFLMTVQDPPEEERRRAEENVRNALNEIHAMVNMNVSRVPPLGNGLNDLTVPRR